MACFIVILYLGLFWFTTCIARAPFLPTCKQKACPPGFTLYDTSSKCYALINTPMIKDAHIAQCTRLAVGAFIAAPLDAGENLFIQSLISNQESSERAKCQWMDANNVTYDGYYLGGETFERQACYTFEWILTGGYKQKMFYNNFNPNEPNCGRGIVQYEYCLQYYKNFGWNDCSCSNNICSVCEFRLKPYE